MEQARRCPYLVSELNLQSILRLILILAPRAKKLLRWSGSLKKMKTRQESIGVSTRYVDYQIRKYYAKLTNLKIFRSTNY